MSEESPELKLGRVLEGQVHLVGAVDRIERKQDTMMSTLNQALIDMATQVQANADHSDTDDRRFDSHGKKIKVLEDKVSDIKPPSKRRQVAQVGGAGTGGALLIWVLDHFTKG